MPDNQKSPPGVLFRSFLLIAGAYILNLLFLCTAGLLIAMTLFPESYAIMNSDVETYNKIIETQPEKVFPPEMLWTLLVVCSAACFGLGYFVARQAPISKFSHAIFFAAILFAQYLQLAVGASEAIQTMLVVFMGVSPIAALLGANFYIQRCGDK